MMTPDLPEELLEEILCRVPAASLKTLQSTCKQWNRLFNETRFKRKHFDKAAKQLLLFTLTEESRVCLLNVNLYNGTPCTEVTGELNLDEVNIDKVSHCDGLLLCTIKNEARIVVWNPCTGQTKWIQPGKNDCCNCSHNKFVLGYSQDKKSCDKSYKILSYNYECDNQLEFKLYDINSNSWRNLDVTLIPDHLYSSYNHKVSFKGKTYWFAPADSKADHLCLISFDYSSESFERLRLPYDQSISYRNASLSVVGEEKLSMLLQRENTSRREIWVTKKIDDETKEMSWSKILEVEVGIRRDMMFGSFLVDEEKKIVVCCEQRDVESKSIITVSFVGEDSNVPQEGFFPVKTMSSSMPFFVDYVPSLIQLPPSFIMFIRASS